MTAIPVQLMFNCNARGLKLETIEVDGEFWAPLSDSEKEAYLADLAEQFARRFASWRAADLTAEGLAAKAE
jgi:hypothetical protein